MQQQSNYYPSPSKPQQGGAGGHQPTLNRAFTASAPRDTNPLIMTGTTPPSNAGNRKKVQQKLQQMQQQQQEDQYQQHDQYQEQQAAGGPGAFGTIFNMAMSATTLFGGQGAPTDNSSYGNTNPNTMNMNSGSVAQPSAPPMYAVPTSTAGTDLSGTARHRSIVELLDNFHGAASRGDIRSYFGCFHANARFLGTVTHENWSMNEYLTFCKPYFDKPGGGWTYIPIPSSRKLNYYPDERTGDVCNFDEQLKTPDSPDVCRGTGTAVYSSFSGCWFIFSYHLSIDTSQDLDRTIREYEAAKARLDAERQAEKDAALKVSKMVINGVSVIRATDKFDVLLES
jgi:hypothetical protein